MDICLKVHFSDPEVQAGSEEDGLKVKSVYMAKSHQNSLENVPG